MNLRRLNMVLVSRFRLYRRVAAFIKHRNLPAGKCAVWLGPVVSGGTFVADTPLTTDDNACGAGGNPFRGGAPIPVVTFATEIERIDRFMEHQAACRLDEPIGV